MYWSYHVIFFCVLQSETLRLNWTGLLSAGAAWCFLLCIKEQRSFIMNLNRQNYIFQVVNLLMVFLRKSIDNPSPSHCAPLRWQKNKKHIMSLGICFMKTSRPVDGIISGFEVMTSRLVCAIDYLINHDFQEISAINMQVCVLKLLVWSLWDQKNAESTISHFSPLIQSSSW